VTTVDLLKYDSDQIRARFNDFLPLLDPYLLRLNGPDYTPRLTRCGSEMRHHSGMNVDSTLYSQLIRTRQPVEHVSVDVVFHMPAQFCHCGVGSEVTRTITHMSFDDRGRVVQSREVSSVTFGRISSTDAHQRNGMTVTRLITASRWTENDDYSNKVTSSETSETFSHLTDLDGLDVALTDFLSLLLMPESPLPR